MKIILLRLLAPALVAVSALMSPAAQAWDFAGPHTLTMQGRDGVSLPVGQVNFVPDGAGWRFTIALDPLRFKDFFLSMKEFKCLEGPEIQCYVPYPYPNPARVTANDLRWLEHALLFMHKSPKEFGAKLWNGLIYTMTLTDAGIDGVVQAVDLNQIGSPPQDLAQPPYGPAERSEIDPDSRWLGHLTIR